MSDAKNVNEEQQTDENGEKSAQAKPKIRKIRVPSDSSYNIFQEPPRKTLPSPQVPSILKTVLEGNLRDRSNLDEEEKELLNLVLKLKHKEANIPPTMRLKVLELLLFMEQHQFELEIKKHSLKEREITRIESDVFKIAIPKIDEEAPFISLGDFVLLQKCGSPEKTWVYLNVIEIGNIYIKARCNKFPKWFVAGSTFNIKYKIRNYSMDCFHFSVNEIRNCNLLTFLYPQKNATTNTVQKIEEKYWFNQNIFKNKEQKQAVEHIISQTAKPAPYILFGPPGTGKTATLVEAIYQIWHKDPANRVLVCAPSNAAADELATRILKCGVPNTDILRYFSPSRDRTSIDENILSSTNFINGMGLHLPKEIILMKKIIVTTLTSSMRLLKLGLRESYFSYIFIDEAGQALEPETLIPIRLASFPNAGKVFCQIILAGDPKQLGPVIKSKMAENLLSLSMLERLMDHGPYKREKFKKYDANYITKLVKNFRSNEKILEIPNKLFYDNELIACAGDACKTAEEWKYLEKKNFPIIFHAVDGEEKGENSNPSTYNEKEVSVVIDYVKKLIHGETTFKPQNIGIVTPFKLQERKIKKSLEKIGIKTISVGTVQIFQGQEKEVIIISTVRSRLLKSEGKTHIGFLEKEKIFNVALTRAKSLLIVIGNQKVLKFDSNWSEFINFCARNNACRGAEEDDLMEKLTTKDINLLSIRKKITKGSVEQNAITEEKILAIYDTVEPEETLISRKIRRPKMKENVAEVIIIENEDDDDMSAENSIDGFLCDKLNSLSISDGENFTSSNSNSTSFRTDSSETSDLQEFFGHIF